MLTIFAIPKPWVGHIGVIQRNAVQSWLQFMPRSDVLLCGDEPGTAETAGELGVRHAGGIERNEFGTPLLSSVFERARSASEHPLLAYANCDIILFETFLESARRVPRDRPFLIVGRRWDLDLAEPVAFADPEWRRRLEERVSGEGVLHSPFGIDYFAFPRDLWSEIPPFAVGRMVYDNWFVYQARSRGVRVVDATGEVLCIHQNHERTYHSVGLEGPAGETGLRDGTEAEHNLSLAGGLRYRFCTEDADWVLGGGGIVRKPWRLRGLMRRIESLGVLHPWLLPLVWTARLLHIPWRLFRSTA